MEELSSRATSRMTSGASRRSRAPTSMGVAPGEGTAAQTVMPGKTVTESVAWKVCKGGNGMCHCTP